MKKITAWLLTVVILLASTVPAWATIELEELDVPYKIKYQVYDDGYCERVNVSCLFTDRFTNFLLYSDAEREEKYNIEQILPYLQLDYRIDGGAWHYNSLWDSDVTNPSFCRQLYAGDTVRSLELFYLNNADNRELAGNLCKVDSKKTPDNTDRYVFDFENHSLYFRLRLATNIYVDGESRILTSDWSDVYTVRRDADFGKAPTELEKPVIRDAQVKYSESNEMPYLSLRFDTSEATKEAEGWFSSQTQSQIGVEALLNTGSGDYEEVSMNTQTGYTTEDEKIIYLDTSDCDDAHTMKLKIRYVTYVDNEPLYSDYSDEVSFSVPRWTEETGVTHPKCKLCGICHPIFGLCMFIWLGILLVVALIVGIILKMKIDKVKAQKAFEEEERQKKIEAEQEARRKLKEEKKLKNKKQP
ncbi:MAG TPA: hypothetical protein DDY98_01525 [Ruminococcaceae bacterium]|nr:hypothetical protein [Oscillospiraceae bacterium]